MSKACFDNCNLLTSFGQGPIPETRPRLMKLRNC